MRIYDVFKDKAADYISDNFRADASILDVGPGAGAVYFHLLENKFKKIDCCEIFEPYVAKYGLDQKYRKVFVSDIATLEFEYYDVVIFGDSLEHLSVPDAQLALRRVYKRCGQIVVVVPYLYKQSQLEIAEFENPYERHLQPDLTPKLMLERYPMLRCLETHRQVGIYIKNKVTQL